MMPSPYSEGGLVEQPALELLESWGGPWSTPSARRSARPELSAATRCRTSSSRIGCEMRFAG